MPRRATKTSFKPGKSGNPNGRPELPADIKEARKLNQVTLERTLNGYLFLPYKDLQRLRADGDLDAFSRIAVGWVIKAEQGSVPHLNILLERLIGRVTDSIEVKTPTPFVITRATGEQVLLGAKVEEEAS